MWERSLPAGTPSQSLVSMEHVRESHEGVASLYCITSWKMTRGESSVLYMSRVITPGPLQYRQAGIVKRLALRMDANSSPTCRTQSLLRREMTRKFQHVLQLGSRRITGSPFDTTAREGSTFTILQLTLAIPPQLLPEKRSTP